MVGDQRVRRARAGRSYMLRYGGPLLAIAIAAVAAFVSNHSESPAAGPMAVRSSGPTFDSLAEVVEASDLVVDGLVTGVADGRLFSNGGPSGVRSQVLTLRVDATLAGRAPGPQITIEEESSTADGRPIEVDRLRPTRLHDEGIFFLMANPDTSIPYYVTVSTQGRYLRTSGLARSDELMGATASGRLAVELAGLGRRGLDDAVRRLAHAR